MIEAPLKLLSDLRKRNGKIFRSGEHKTRGIGTSHVQKLRAVNVLRSKLRYIYTANITHRSSAVHLRKEPCSDHTTDWFDFDHMTITATSHTNLSDLQ